MLRIPHTRTRCSIRTAKETRGAPVGADAEAGRPLQGGTSGDSKAPGSMPEAHLRRPSQATEALRRGPRGFGRTTAARRLVVAPSTVQVAPILRLRAAAQAPRIVLGRRGRKKSRAGPGSRMRSVRRAGRLRTVRSGPGGKEVCFGSSRSVWSRLRSYGATWIWNPWRQTNLEAGSKPKRGPILTLVAFGSKPIRGPQEATRGRGLRRSHGIFRKRSPFGTIRKRVS